MSGFVDTVQWYLRMYKKSVSEFWTHLSPQDYATILILVAFAGWVMMRSNLK